MLSSLDYSNPQDSELKGSIFGMGSPLLDICAEVDDSVLEKYNLKPNDAILATEKHMPLYQELISNKNVFYIAGGATQNSLRGAQRLLPRGSTVFVGCVSNDDYAKKLFTDAQSDGLKTLYMIDETLPTGTCATLITGKNRSLVANLSASNNYKLTHLLRPDIWSCVQQAKIFYISGFFVCVSVECILKVCEHAQETGKFVALNLSAPRIPEFHTDTLKKLLEYCDVLFGNETEARALSTAFGYETDNVAEIAKKIVNYPKINQSRPRIVVITQGPSETILATKNDLLSFEVLKISEEEIVDTNGAGDAFVGGFLSQFIQKNSLEECVKAGHFLSKIVLQQAGPHYPKNIPNFN